MVEDWCENRLPDFLLDAASALVNFKEYNRQSQVKPYFKYFSSFIRACSIPFYSGGSARRIQAIKPATYFCNSAWASLSFSGMDVNNYSGRPFSQMIL